MEWLFVKGNSGTSFETTVIKSGGRDMCQGPLRSCRCWNRDGDGYGGQETTSDLNSLKQQFISYTTCSFGQSGILVIQGQRLKGQERSHRGNIGSCFAGEKKNSGGLVALTDFSACQWWKWRRRDGSWEDQMDPGDGTRVWKLVKYGRERSNCEQMTFSLCLRWLGRVSG